MHVLRLKSRKDAEGLCAALDKLDAVAIRPDLAGSVEELALARHLAESSFLKKSNIARQMRYEFLLWLSGRTDIKSAMKDSAPGASECIVIVFSGMGSEEVCRMLDADELPLDLKKDAEPLALERISLSRVR